MAGKKMGKGKAAELMRRELKRKGLWQPPVTAEQAALNCYCGKAAEFHDPIKGYVCADHKTSAQAIKLKQTCAHCAGAHRSESCTSAIQT